MRRVFCSVGSAFLLGSFIFSFLNLTKQIIILIICFLVLALILFHKKFSNIKSRKYIALLIAIGFTGMLFFTANDVFRYNKIAALDGTFGSLTGRVTEKRVSDDGNYTYEVCVSQAQNNHYSAGKVKIKLYTNKNLNAKLYDEIRLDDVEFFIPTNSDMFNSVRYNKSKNIFICARWYKFDDNLVPIVTTPTHYPIKYYIASLNEKLCSEVDRKFPKEAAALIKGVILGDRSSIDFSLDQSYRDSGAAHLFSISGTHISILAGAILFLLQGMSKRVKIPIVLTVITAYILISGAQVSAVRSGFMLSAMLISQLFYRENDSPNSLFAAGFIIVLADPFAVMDLGFLMSFLATFGVVVLAPWAQRIICSRFKIKDVFKKKLVAVLCMGFFAEVMLVPVFVLSFRTISLISPVTNLITSITIVPIVILGFLSVLLINTPVLGVLLLIETPIILLQNKIVTILGNLPFSIVGVDYTAFSVWLIFCAVIVSLSLIWRRLYPKKSVVAGGSILCTLLFVVSILSVAYEQKNDLSLYLVGDATTTNIVVIRKNAATVISTADDNYIDRLTLSFLKGKGIRKIDNLILTYPQFSEFKDTTALVESLEISNIYYNNNDHNFKSAFNSSALKLDATTKIHEINDELHLSLFNEVDIDFSYVKANLNLTITHGESTFLISDYKTALSHSDSTINFIRGNLPKEVSKLPKNAVLLEKHYKKEVESSFYSSENKVTRIELDGKKRAVMQQFE